MRRPTFGRRLRHPLARRLATLALVAGGGAWAAACSDVQPPPITTEPTLADSADQVMFNVRFGLIRDGIRRGELFADTAFVFDQNARMELRGVRSNFYTEGGSLQGTLVAREGTYNSREGLLEARGDADVTTADGRKLTSPQLRYNVNQNQVLSDSSFVLTEPGRRVAGVGFSSDPSLRNVIIRKTTGGTGGAITIPGQ
ncbi:MAG: LPS export ABC transporter periplasmic protein LptC [Gemmatimonadaceae bacterium]